MLKVLQNNPIATLLLLVVAMLAFSHGNLPVSIMEARNFITAREMITDGNWLLTTMNGMPRYEKPPLPTWLTAIFALFFGAKNIIALRFPAVLFVALTGIGIFKLSKKLLNDHQQSFRNALIGITSFYVIGIIIEAPWDIFAHGFMVIALFFLFQFFQDKTIKKNALLAGCFIGFSMLSKGPISAYALLLPFLIAYGLVFKFKFSRKQWMWALVCLTLAMVIGGWWYLYVRLTDPETFKAIADKETSNWGSYNVKPFYYYWSFFTQSGIWTIPAFIGLLYPYLKSKVSNLKVYRFSLLWTMLSLILLSIVPEKKARYLMPVLIPLAINTGFYVEYLIQNFKHLKNNRESIPVYFNFGLIALIGVMFPVSVLWIGHQLSGIFLFWFIMGSLILVSLGVILLINLKRKMINHVFYSCIIFMASLLIIVLPLSEIQKQGNYNPISDLKEEASEQGLNVFSMNYIAPEIIFQYSDKIPSLIFEDGKVKIPNDSKFGLLSNHIDPNDLKALESAYIIEKLETYDLNLADEKSKKYNTRLKSDYYVLTKK